MSRFVVAWLVLAAILAAIILGALMLSQNSETTPNVAVTPPPPTPMGKTAVIRIGTREFLAEVANTEEARSRGLSGREPLGENEAMLFLFDPPTQPFFWMREMQFPIDIIWIRGARIVGIEHGVRPMPGRSLESLPRYAPPELVDRVLEWNAGTAATLNLEPGQEVEILLP